MSEIESRKSEILISKILIVLYLLTPLSPFIEPYEYEGFQWLYFSIINLASIALIIWKPENFNALNISKSFKVFGIIGGVFICIAMLSMIKSIFITESLVHLSRLFNIAIGTFIFYTFCKNSPKEYFGLICKTLTLILLFYNLRTVAFVLDNLTKPRINSLYLQFLAFQKFGNINIYTAWVVCTIPFTVFLFSSKKKYWNYIAMITYAIAIFSLFYSGSRTALISLILISLVLLVFSFKNYLTERKSKWLILFLAVIISPIFSIFTVLNTHRLYKNKSNPVSSMFVFYPDNYRSVDRILRENKGLEKSSVILPESNSGFFTKIIQNSGSGRYHIWRSALNMLKDNLFLGVGYGNYQVTSKEDYYQHKTRPIFKNLRRVHNDYLEKFVETGIVGGFLYVSLLCFLLFRAIQNIRTKKEYSLINIVLTCSLLAYMTDAFFNFPLERAPMQIYMGLLAGIILFRLNKEPNVLKPTTNKSSLRKELLIPSILALIVITTIISNFKVYKSFKTEIAVLNEIKNTPPLSEGKTYKKTFKQLKNDFGTYPIQLSTGCLSNYLTMLYATHEKDYTNALKTSNLYKNYNIDQYATLRVKAEIFNKGLKQNDSAKFYAEKVYNDYPSFSTNYNFLKSIYFQEKDTIKATKLTKDYLSKAYKDVNEWIKYANFKNKKGKFINHALKILDSGLAYNKGNRELTYKLIEAKSKLQKHNKVNKHIKKKEIKKAYDQIVSLYKEQKFKTAIPLLLDLLAKEPKDHFAKLYLGICKMQVGEYKEAINHLSVVINKGVFPDGKAEFCRGYCYEKLKDTINFKKDYKASRDKGFPQALKLPKSKYN